jgi:hypothetical protein
LVDAVGSLLKIPWYLPDFWSVFPASLAIRLPVDMFTYWLLLGFWEVSRGHEKYRQQKQLALQSELQLSDLRIQLATAQLAVLKNQLAGCTWPKTAGVIRQHAQHTNHTPRSWARGSRPAGRSDEDRIENRYMAVAACEGIWVHERNPTMHRSR